VPVVPADPPPSDINEAQSHALATPEVPAEPVVANDAVLDPIRRAEVLARSTAARLFDGKRTSIEESAARQAAAAGGLTEPRPTPEKARDESRKPDSPPARRAPETAGSDERLSVAAAGMVPADETLPGDSAEMAEPLDALAGPVEPLVTAGIDPEAPRKGRLLGPREGEPIVGHLVRVLPGDTVWDIAVAHYGSAGPVTLKRILNSNPLVRDPRNLEAGSHIYLPFQRPDQMVQGAENGTYHVVVAIAPQQARLEQVRDWIKGLVPGAQVTTATAESAGDKEYRLQIVGLTSRETALGLASDILAEYGRSRFGGALPGRS
jgi:nucleoid-associated protein YgaU